MDLLLYIGFRLLVWAFNLLPFRARAALAGGLARFSLILIPRYRRIADLNLQLVFPEKDESWRKRIMRQSCRSLGLVFADFVRIPQLDRDWAQRHVDFPQIGRFKDIIAAAKPKGVMLVSGHLGSFEFLPYCMAAMVEPMAFVARGFKQKRIDAWWNGVRCLHGNTLIPRKGAIKGILRNINAGRAVGFLFDQNMVRNQAFFVDWFGRPAATTKALGLAAVRTETPVLLFAIRTVALDHYRLEMREFDFEALYRDAQLGFEEKAVEVTARVTKEFEKMVREDPSAWFWVHRRWKTTPLEGQGNYYEGSGKL